ncbi:DUF5781 family protein [Halocatena pleomorpha]|uniref:Uncharacterized protein n=1 Tax=Halocatena pleomorpha TaxID=1785090 RepID=A0A3P3RJT1_9EURY|nr:DUF5781 family protein [Halocatena pleomorpha]RRJ32693.1 hypothetical protein EIK79_04350 [Halocatena pleomorpha]
MEVHVQGGGPADPFLSARDVFETEYDLNKRVFVRVRSDPDERTWTAHYDDHHLLNMSHKTARSTMARELALHEFSHMHRNEQQHPSHTQSTAEAIYLALAGQSVERRTLAHCYQIANHMKDIYADDITLDVTPSNKLVTFLESGLAGAIINQSTTAPVVWSRLARKAERRSGSNQNAKRSGDITRIRDSGQQPEPASSGDITETQGVSVSNQNAKRSGDITAVNAAFALALCERHGLVGTDHRLYDLAHAAANDAPNIDLDAFKSRFRTLTTDPDEAEYRNALVDVTRAYTASTNG